MTASLQAWLPERLFCFGLGVCADGAGRGLNGAHTRRRSGGRAWENARRAVGAQEETAVESARMFAPIVAIRKLNVTGSAKPIVQKRVSINRLPQDDTPQSNRINGAGVCANRCHPQLNVTGTAKPIVRKRVSINREAQGDGGIFFEKRLGKSGDFAHLTAGLEHLGIIGVITGRAGDFHGLNAPSGTKGDGELGVFPGRGGFKTVTVASLAERTLNRAIATRSLVFGNLIARAGFGPCAEEFGNFFSRKGFFGGGFGTIFLAGGHRPYALSDFNLGGLLVFRLGRFRFLLRGLGLLFLRFGFLFNRLFGFWFRLFGRRFGRRRQRLRERVGRGFGRGRRRFRKRVRCRRLGHGFGLHCVIGLFCQNVRSVFLGYNDELHRNDFFLGRMLQTTIGAKEQQSQQQTTVNGRTESKNPRVGNVIHRNRIVSCPGTWEQPFGRSSGCVWRRVPQFPRKDV